MLGETEAAREIVQVVHERVLKSEGSFRGEATMITWVLKITHNECVRYRESLSELATPLGDEDPPAPDDSPLEALEKADFRQKVEIFMARLSPRQSRALTLSVNEGLSLKEIAEDLGISIDLAAKTLQRAREKMKDMMTKGGISP